MIKTNIKLNTDFTYDDIKAALREKLPLDESELSDIRILRKHLNINDRSDIFYDLSIGIALSEDREKSLLNMRKKVSAAPDLSFNIPESRLGCRPVIIGAGPAGLFAALVLAEAGAEPIIYERGLSVDERADRVRIHRTLGILDPECNVQFGEGGAGAYSDGKLKYGSPDKYKMKVLTELVRSGAPEDITYSTSAHVGTDLLPKVVKDIRERIVALGGEVHFSAKLTDIRIKDGRVVGGTVKERGESVDFECEKLIIAAGHSARDVFELLRAKGAQLEARGFGIGARIEHKREYIDKLMLGENPPAGVGAASYHLVTHLPSGRSVYSFCMCPGGEVVAAASEQGGIVTNGMSEYARDGENSNAALLVSVTPEDFLSSDPLAGLALQRSIEQKAFALSGSFSAPAQRLDDFLRDKRTLSFGEVKPSYPLGTVNERLDEALPGYITEAIRAAIGDFDAWLPGYYRADSTLTAPETRSTSPIRVLRWESFEALGISGLYPIGEGAGYAGGIVSSARDGVMAAEKILLDAIKNIG